MYKLVGIFCIFLGCLGYGISRIGEERSRVGHLREMIRVIRRMQDEISYGKHTLPEICLIMAEYCNESYQPFFNQIYEQVCKGSGIPLEHIWEQQMSQCLHDTPLSDEEKDVLRKLPKNMGMQEERLQAESIGRSKELLVRNCRKAEDAYENKAKMILSVSALTGVFLTILLL